MTPTRSGGMTPHPAAAGPVRPDTPDHCTDSGPEVCGPEASGLERTLPDDLPEELDRLLRGGGLGAGGLYWKLGIRLLEATPDLVRGTMPVGGNTQPYGVLHGGASIAFAETLASVAAAMHAGPGRIAVGIEVSASHHKAARSGLVHGTAAAIHRGAELASYEVVVRDDADRPVSSCRVSCLLRRASGRLR